MTYRVRIDDIALRDIENFAAYLSGYSESFALEQIERVTNVFHAALAEAPTTWGYFYLTGAPYRAYLFRVGRRTQYWIIYTVDEAANTVDVLRFWNASRDPEAFDV